jgi:uncharacterized protein YecE (DUF72 family)
MTRSRSNPSAAAPAASIRVGIGGWTYAPWRDNFYPAGLVQRLELEYASRQLTSIEINGTFHREQTPTTYAKWREQTPPGFVFSVKAPGRITASATLAKMGGAVAHFLDGIVALEDRLGPIVWQFDPGKRFVPDDFAAFLELLPKQVDGRHLRHVLDVRHESFLDPGYIALARSHRLPTVCADSTEYPCIGDITGDFVYARLMRTQSQIATGYAAADLDRWADRAREWAGGGDLAELPHLGPIAPQGPPRDVFVYFISGAKERAPAAAKALLQRLST